MKMIYNGFSYRIVCRSGRHDWLRMRHGVPPSKRLFASKPCDCAELKKMGVPLPFSSALKVALNYMAPCYQVSVSYREENHAR